MKVVRVIRFGSIPTMGTFGMLEVLDNGELLYVCRAVEREDQNNRPNVSCIPEGIYTMKLGMYYGGDGVGGRRDYPAYVVQDVPGRSLIKIHVANTAKQLKGCIAPGLDFGTLGGEWAVKSSRDAFESIMETLRNDVKVEREIMHG